MFWPLNAVILLQKINITRLLHRGFHQIVIFKKFRHPSYTELARRYIVEEA